MCSTQFMRWCEFIVPTTWGLFTSQKLWNLLCFHVCQYFLGKQKPPPVKVHGNNWKICSTYVAGVERFTNVSNKTKLKQPQFPLFGSLKEMPISPNSLIWWPQLEVQMIAKSHSSFSFSPTQKSGFLSILYFEHVLLHTWGLDSGAWGSKKPNSIRVLMDEMAREREEIKCCCAMSVQALWRHPLLHGL